jgi:(p)ppGpp synthase/HD superfamily hydrolase
MGGCGAGIGFRCCLFSGLFASKFPLVILSHRFEQALQYAAIVHAGQMRKRSDVPYLAHLLGVASIAMEYGADEDEAIASLLHDAVEDAGGEARLQDIFYRFGENAAEIVNGCTDSRNDPKPPWRARKASYIAHLPHASPSIRLVSAADKLYNARVALKDLRMMGNATWEAYNGGKEGTLWYFRCLVQAFKAAGNNPLVEELERTVLEIEQLCKALDAEEVLAKNAAGQNGTAAK